jgi:outer membrane protein OmpA-like peptidoglycan-associated protein/ABC-type nitrate/sulfonate/bicarbonate transport system substrate-binding protein
MKLTPFAKLFITVVVLAVLGVTTWHYFQDEIRCWSAPDKCTKTTAKSDNGQTTTKKDTSAASGAVSKEDFTALGSAPPDPGKGGVTGVQKSTVTGGKLDRPLRVGINTWAGHAPGIVANLGLAPGQKGSIYKKDFDLDVDMKIIEDPAAKLAAFQAGQIDIMWDTVDSWAREASVLAEGSARGRAIIMEDWSRGGDGIVALTTIKSVEDLAGKKIATTEFTPSHWLILYLLNQSGLSPEQKKEIEKSFIITQDAPAAAAMFKSKKVDAAVTWEPDLSGAVSARGDDAHILISTTAATNVIADVLVARQEIIDQAPQTLAAFVAGWFEGIEAMKKDPAGTNQVIANALKLDTDTVSGMLSGLKLTPFADTAQFFGLAGSKPHFETLFDTAFRIWRKKGVVTKVVDAKEHYDTRFVAALADKYKGQTVVEAKLEPRKVNAKDTPIINKTLTINFTPGSDEIMPGSFFTLDSLGETMTSFGNTYLRIEGNTDATGSRPVNIALSERRASAVKNYLVKNHGIPAERFQTLGHGPDKPVAPNTSEAGRQLNRRTDIKVILAAPS